MIFINFKILFFGVVCLACQSLFAQNACDAEFDNLQLNVNGEITRLADDICKLLLKGYSIDEVITKLYDGKKHAYDLQKLVQHIYKQVANNHQINAADSCNVPENTPQRKKNGSKIKTFYKYVLALKSFAYLVLAVIILVVCFFIYKYGKLLLDLISSILEWLLHFFKKLNISNIGPEDENLPHTENPQALETRYEQNQASIEPVPQELPNPKIIQTLKIELNHHDEEPSTVKVQVEHRQDIPAPIIEETPLPTQTATIKPRVGQASAIDFTLNYDLEQQITHAKSIGLEPIMMQFGAINPNTEPVGTREKFYGLKIAEQIEYAKSIGLVPEVTPATE